MRLVEIPHPTQSHIIDADQVVHVKLWTSRDTGRHGADIWLTTGRVIELPSSMGYTHNDIRAALGVPVPEVTA